jgi:uncharacterized protein (TIGR02996 family)
MVSRPAVTFDRDGSMRLPRFANPLARRLRLDRLTAAELPRMARNPSYRAPNAADVLDPARAQPPDPPPVSDAERRLLDAVLADPDADAPRLAYADWAERQGDVARANLIREQIRGGRGLTPINADQARRNVPSADLRSSASICGSTAFAAFGAKDLVVRRGFVEGMSVSGRAFISLGGELLRLTPLREVRLVAVQPYMGELAHCPHLAKLRRLDLFGNRIGAVGVRELAGSEFLGGLRELGLSANDPGSDGLARLVAAPWLGNLAAVALADNGVGPRELKVLAAAPFREIAALDLSRNPLGERGATGLARADFVSRLRRLALFRCDLGTVGARLLFIGRLGSLAVLDVSFNHLGPGGAVALAEDDSLTHLTALDLGFNDIESAGAEAIAAGAALGSLVSLNLAGNRITEPGAQALASSDVLGSVEELDLTANPLGDGGAVALVKGEAFASLSRLCLANCGLTDVGVGRLAVTGALGGLRSLSLAWNPFGDGGATALAACPDLAGLRELDLTGTRIGFAGAIALVESRSLTSLRRVGLGENHRLAADAAAILRERFGTITA